MPEDEFIAFMRHLRDVFDLIWLEKDFSAKNEKDRIGNRTPS